MRNGNSEEIERDNSLKKEQGERGVEGRMKPGRWGR